MLTIKSKNDLLTAYIILSMNKDRIKGNISEKRKKELSDKIIELKKDIRNFYKKNNNTNFNVLQAIKNNYKITFCIDKIEDNYKTYYLENKKMSKEEIKSYFRENQINSPYDCTGYLFLSSLEIKQLKNGKYLYIETWYRDI